MRVRRVSMGTTAPGRIPMRFSWRFAFLLLLPVTPFSAEAESVANGSTCFSERIVTEVSGFSRHGDIGLASGQNIHLADIALPEREPWRNEAFRKLKSLVGKQVEVSFDGKADRWSRHRATVEFSGQDVASQLVDGGLALVDSGESGVLCNPTLLEIEQRARDRQAGFWSKRSTQTLSALAPEMILKHEGRFALVEGHIIGVGIRKKWTYLNFGRDWKSDFTVSISSAVWAKMQESGLNAETLKGKSVRVRGIIRQWNGPSLEILAPEMLEITDRVRDRT